jgi:hypothetical protein
MNHEVESPAMSRDRKDIYLGERLRQALEGRGEPLTTVVNLIADRYLGIIEREHIPTLVAHEAMLIETLREKSRPLSSTEIATLPAMVEDWMRRHPDYMPEPAQTLLMILRNCKYPSLVALVDRIERLI